LAVCPILVCLVGEATWCSIRHCVVIGMLGSVTLEVKWSRAGQDQVRGQKGISWQWGQGHQRDQR
jgi:hypothetical protein